MTPGPGVRYGVILSNKDKIITHVSDGFTDITGYTVQESIGRPCSFIQGKATNRQTIKMLSQQLSENKVVRVYILNYRKDQTPFWNMLTIAPLLDMNGRITQFVGIQV